MKYILKCQICGQEFTGSYKDMTTCKSCKNRPCEVCGKPFVHPWPYDQHCCSDECRKIWKSDPERNKEWTEKRIATNQAKYGVNNVSELKEVREKISKNHTSQEFKDKVRKTSLAKYGVEHYQQSEEIKEKTRQSNLRKYGVDCPSKTDRVRKLLSERASSPEFRARYAETCMKHYGVPHPHMVPEIHQKAVETTLEKYGVPYYVMLPEYRTAQASKQISKPNKEFASKLNELGLETEFETVVGNKPFDICVPKANIVIEINPSYTHSIVPNHWHDAKSPDYHLKKTELAIENGYRCIHIFDWDSTEKVAAMFQSKQVVYGRNCKLIHVDFKEASEFINNYHLQGNARGAKFAYGLIYNDKLVSVMTFGVPRYNKNYQWELLRLCTDPSYRIVGGASKMFNQFLKDANPESIISYCDRAKFTGEVYNKLGFKLHHFSPPALVWSLEDQYITDNLLRQRGYDQLFNTNYGKGAKNDELMLNDGWLPVYDCGQMVFEWKRPQ